MKKFFFCTLSLLFAAGVFAQGTVDPNVRKAADEMIKIYNLDQKQSAVALEIQERRFRNLAEIESLENTDKDLYRHKIRAIQQSTDASLRRMLDEEQMTIYNQRKMDIRNKKAARSAELKEQGLSMEEIEDTLLELEDY